MHASLTAEQAYTTVELKIAYHRALTAEIGLVHAEAHVVSLGKRVAFSEGRLTDTQGRLYASTTSTLLILECKAAKG